ncbi:MFS transporter [Pseudarthrobacter sp. SSS035]|uniref:MFS transporter n=1 Tax=Pseudarthrobacter sp. SSS035 TaxID=2931399 RepID=UPI00200D7B75|nr:MFS transporter [Pseudarthrobacter sp. SSS035]
MRGLGGAAVGWLLIDRVGRRLILIVPMFATCVFLVLVALNKVLDMSVGVTVTAFFGYLFFYGIMSILCGVYPLEVFPTSVRTSGMGFAAAMSRVGAATGTFLLPIVLASFGLNVVLFGLAAVCLIGGVTAFFMAPETAGKELTETGSPQGTDRKVRREPAVSRP